MNSREETKEPDLFLDELEYLLGPVIGLYKTTKNTRKYIISGLNSIDEELKGITFASFNNNLNFETCIKYIDHWISYIKRMKIEIERFQNLSNFEQNALKIRIDFINNKYKQIKFKTKLNYFDNYYIPYCINDKNKCLNKEDKEDKEDKNEIRIYMKNRNYKSIWIDRLLIDYFSRNLYFKTAYALIEDNMNNNNNLNILTNIRLYHKIREVLNAIENRNCHIIIKWCRANKTLLKNNKKIKSNLEFMAKTRFVIELLRNDNIGNAIKYITNQMNKDLDTNSKYRWNIINQLFICSMYVPIMFNFKNNQKYSKLLAAKNNNNNKILYKKYKKEYKNDLKKKVPKNVYKMFFKPGYYWKKIEKEFWRVFKLVYGLNKYSMFEYTISSSLQTLLTPYCYHKEWTHLNCYTCLHSKSKVSQLTHKSHLRGIELPYSFIVSDRIHSITHLLNDSRTHNNDKKGIYQIINNFMINYQQSMTISSNNNALIAPNGSIIHKESADTLVATNKFIKKDFEKIFLYYHLF